MIWDYTETSNSQLNDVVSDEILIELKGLVGCELVKDLNFSRIYIGAPSEEQARLALCKLDTIHKFWASTNYTKVK